MRCIIAGSRGFRDKELLQSVMEEFNQITEVVSGGAKGADHIGEWWAIENNIPIKRFIPNWDLYGRAAGPIRNGEMAKYADLLVVFWDGESRGTADMVAQMRRDGKQAIVVQYPTSQER
jgi:hypothetical protein